MPLTTVDELRDALGDGEELALLDVREVGDYVEEHLLFAVNAPLSRLELMVGDLVPRRTVRTVLVDAAEERVHEAAARLKAAGYRSVSVLRGGTRAWKAAGYEVYLGRNTPGVVFGEVVQHELATPEIGAAVLQAQLQAGEDVIVLDTRPRDEFEEGHIAGAIACAGAELAYRAQDLGRSPQTRFVVNCGGRTRAILGAQGLINLGVENPVAALSGGTMEWLLAGFELEAGPGRSAPLPSRQTADEARQRASHLSASSGVRRIDEAILAGFEREKDVRTLYCFDVRSAEEYAAGHPPGFRSAPDGELFSRVVKYIGTRGARVVLFDSEAVRDVYTASWLIQQGGYEIYVLRSDPQLLETGPQRTRILEPKGPAAPWIDVLGLQKAIAEGSTRVFDVDISTAFQRRHVAGAVFVPRQQLAQRAAVNGRPIVLTSADGVLARIAATELQRTPGLDVRALLGGTRAWIAAGAPTESGGLDARANDVWIGPGSGAPADRHRRMREYLDWELSLPAQHARDGSAPFHILNSPKAGSSQTAAAVGFSNSGALHAR